MMYDWPALLPLLKTTRFPRLRELELGLYYVLEDRSKGFDIPYFLPHIRNAPSLKKPVLRNCAIDLEFLDQVHASCPHLESLILDLTHIVIRNQTLNQPIVPADSLLSLKIYRAFCFDTNRLLFDYINSKYRHLEQLKFSVKEDYQRYNFSTYYTNIYPSDDSEDDSEEFINEFELANRGTIQRDKKIFIVFIPTE
jgi:hypothetical protein